MGMQMNVAKTETQFLGKGNQEFEIQLNGQKLVVRVLLLSRWNHKYT